MDGMQDRLSDSERRSLLDQAAESSAVDVAAIAEASGLSVEEVRAQIDRIRAEKAFVKEEKPKASRMSLIGAIILVPLAGLVWWRTYAASQPPEKPKQPTQATTPSNFESQFRNMPLSKTSTLGGRNPLPEVPASFVVQTGPGSAPSGIRVEIAGSRSGYLADGISLESRAPNESYDQRLQHLVTCLAILGHDVQIRDAEEDNHGAPAYRDMDGNEFAVKKGMFHYAIFGKANRTIGYLPYLHYPLTKREKTDVLGIATKALARSNDGSADIQPPPGFTVIVDGVQHLVYEASAGEIGPGDRKALQSQFVKFISDAIDRDRRLAKPGTALATAMVTINGPKENFSFDVPLNDSDSARKVLEQYSLQAAAEVR